MSIVRSPVRSVVRSPVRGVLGGGVTLLGQATAYLAGVEPYHWFDFINDRCLYASNDVGGVSGATGYSFARASAGYYTNADGTLTSFASGALRRGNRGVLIEGARTNLFLRSQEFGNWSPTSVTVTADTQIAPNGTLTADTVTCSAGTSSHRVYQTLTAPAAPCTISVYLKAGTTRYVQVYNGADSAYLATADLVGGAVTQTGAKTTASIEALANGWYRFIVTLLNTGTPNNTFFIGAATGPAQAYGESFNAAGTETFHIWGAQLEAASFPSSYIPTTTASATRAGSDFLPATTSGLDSAVSMWAQAFFPGTTGAVQTIAQFDDGTANNRLILRRNASGNAEMELITGGVSQGTVTGGAMANNTTHKIACSATANALRLSLNGTSATPDTSASMPTGLANFRVGAGISIGLPSFAYHPRAAMFNSALSAANLDLVTT